MVFLKELKRLKLKFKMAEIKEFNIRKKIAKHGSNTIIVIPKLLQEDLPRGTIVELNIKVLESARDGNENE